MAIERRQRRVPFRAQRIDDVHQAVFASDESLIGVVAGGPTVADFIVRACNRYDPLMKAFDLCRGHVNGTTIQPGNPTLKGFQEIADELLRDIQKDGR